MSPMLTTRSRAVTLIVEKKQRELDHERFERMKKSIIDMNWQELKTKGFGYSPFDRAEVTLNYEEGRMLHQVMPDKSWENQRCFIIGGGESLKDFDFSTLQNELVIGVNRAYEKMDCTVNFAMDNKLYKWITEGKLGATAKRKFEDFKGFRVWLDSAGYDYPKGVFVLEKNPKHGGGSSIKNGIRSGTNAGFGALNLAISLGANPIYLLGFDMKGNNGKQTWWHEGYPEERSDEVYRSFINDFKKRALEWKRRSIRIINLNEQSALKCFRFGKFKDVKPIRRPVITSYYTKGTGYEKQVKELKTTLRRFNLENDVVGIKDRGSWHKNTYYKAQFVMRMMEKYPDRPIVFVDADAKMRCNPVLFNNFDCDFACHFLHGKELLSGTLYLGNTKGSRFIVRKWIEENKLYPTTHMPQKNLRAVFNKHKDKIKWKELPVEYCMIFDSYFRNKANPVIEHFQLSRVHKNSKGKKYKYRMEKSLDEIRKFCKDKRVCLVGNADSIFEKKRRIDSFDVVCRMNRGTPCGKEKYIGKRTDILFLSTNMAGENIKKLFDPKFVVWMTICRRLASQWTLGNAIQNPGKDWKRLHHQLGINPTTGIMSLKFMLKRMEFKSLTIYGFDFFATKSWYNMKVDSGQKHSGKKEKVLFMEMIKDKKNVRFI